MVHLPERGRRKKVYLMPTFLLPLPRPDEEGLQEGPRDLREKVLTRGWDTASSRFTESGSQNAFSGSAPRSQDTLLNTPLNTVPLPWEGVRIPQCFQRWSFLIQVLLARESLFSFLHPCDLQGLSGLRASMQTDGPAQSAPVLPCLPAPR